MILWKIINSLSKTDDFIKNHKFTKKCLAKPMILQKNINLLSKTDDFIKIDKLLIETGKA